MSKALPAKFAVFLIYVTFIIIGIPAGTAFADSQQQGFADAPLQTPLVLPDWFKLSFLDLREDLQEARASERGLIIYFGRHDCPYCKAQLEKNWGQDDIVRYTRRHFDVVAIDVLGDRQVTDFNGREMSEKSFAAIQHANFTPTLFFYDNRGELALKLAGYRPPYQFRAALEYAADHHQHEGSFRAYLARAEGADRYGLDKLNSYPEFRSPAFLSTYAKQKPRRPLLVVFERSHCHACDVLHAGPLNDPRISRLLNQIDAVQLDMWRNVPVVTPGGRHTTSKRWAEALDLSYAPTLIFYDEQGKEIIRVDSVVGFYRLRGVLRYVIDGGYRRFPTYQQWRQQANRREPTS